MDQLDIAGVLIGMELKKRVQKCDSSNLTVDLVRIIFILFDLSSQEQNHFFQLFCQNCTTMIKMHWNIIERVSLV